MKSVYISDWHMKKLVENLQNVLDSYFQVVPMLQNTGIKVFTQWHSFDARFYFASKDAVEVRLSPGWNEINRGSLVTAILRTFRWDYQPPPRLYTCCCFSWRRNQGSKLQFKM